MLEKRASEIRITWSYIGDETPKRKRERHRHRQRNRETETEKDRDRETEREKDSDRDRDRQRRTERHRQRYSDTKHIERKKDRVIYLCLAYISFLLIIAS